MEPLTAVSLGIGAASSAFSLFGGLFGSKKAPKRVIPAPFTDRYIPRSMIWGDQAFEPEHFIDITTMQTLRVNNLGEKVVTGALNEADQAYVKAWIDKNFGPTEAEDDFKKAVAQPVPGEDVVAATQRITQAMTKKTRPGGTTVLTSGLGAPVSPSQVGSPTLGG